MTEIVRARHPVPALYTPRGGRAVVGGMFSEETPVPVRRAAAEAFVPLPPIDHAVGGYASLHAHEGALWVPLTKSAREPGRDFVKPADFLAWLADAEAGEPIGDPRLLAATPLLAGWDPQVNPFRPGPPLLPWGGLVEGVGDTGSVRVKATDLAVDRGAGPRALDGAREVAWTGSEAARAALVRFMEDDVRVTQRRVYLRARPLLCVQANYSQGMCPDLFLGHHRPVDPSTYTIRPYPMRLDRAREVCPTWNPSAKHPPLGTDAVAARIPPELHGDADLDLMANWMPALAIAVHNRIGASRGLDRNLYERLRGDVDPIRPVGLLGLVGANAGERREASLGAAEGALAALDAAAWHRADRGCVRMALAYLRAEILPRIAEPGAAADPEDVAALDRLAP